MSQVTIHQEANTLIAQLSGEIDHHAAEQMRIKIDNRVNELCPKILVLDFALVSFMDSSGIGLILGRHKLVNAIGGMVVVQKVSSDIQKVLALAGIDSKD